MNQKKTEQVNINTLRHLAQLQAKSPDILLKQMRQLLAQWPAYIDELDKALAKSDFSGAADILHRLKGHCGMLGFSGIYNEASLLEQICVDNSKLEALKPCTSKHLKDSFEIGWESAASVLPIIRTLRPPAGP